MKVRAIMAAVLLILASVAMTGCESSTPSQPGPAEKAGEAAGDALRKAGEATDTALEKAGEATGTALEKAGEGLEKAGEKVKEAVGDDR
jgi:hypothetical protein